MDNKKGTARQLPRPPLQRPRSKSPFSSLPLRLVPSRKRWKKKPKMYHSLFSLVCMIVAILVAMVLAARTGQSPLRNSRDPSNINVAGGGVVVLVNSYLVDMQF